MITDFNRTQGDKLVVTRLLFEIDQDSPFRIVNNATANTTTLAGNTFVYEQDSKRLWWDADGSGEDYDPVLVATLTAGPASLTAEDFLLI